MDLARHYEIEGELGRGGMGRVLRARHRATGALRAIKILADGRDAEEIARFRREAEALARVGGGVVPVHEAGLENGRFYYVMDLLAGGSLRQLLEREQRLPWREAATVGAKLARTLARCHANGIIHRDVKPENVLLDDQGEPRLTDFGCARDLSVQKLTATGTVIGTPAYMPPEQLHGRSVDFTADVFGLGVLLYELIAGFRPHEGTTWVALCEAAENARRLRLRDVAGTPDALDAVIDKALAARPEARYRSLEAFARDLDALVRLGNEARTKTADRPRRVVLAASLVALASLAVVGTAIVVRGSSAGVVLPSVPPPLPRTQGAAPEPTRSEPAWFLALREELRPALPLPEGLRFGERAGEYVWTRDGSVLVFVPGGPCELGSPSPEHEELPRGSASVPAFFVGKHEVTNALFARFVAATSYRTVAEVEGMSYGFRPTRRSTSEDWDNIEGGSWRAPQGLGSAAPSDHPVVAVSQDDALAYAEWAGLRLPTEAEWEKAASWDPRRRASTGRYPWGDDLRSSEPAANFRDRSMLRVYEQVGGERLAERLDEPDDGHARTAPVGSFPRDCSPVGALDLAGNVHEWCSDHVVSGQGMLETRPIRGGSWASGGSWVRMSRRLLFPASVRSDATGFRVALGATRSRR